jgi:hypothetical protein
MTNIGNIQKLWKEYSEALNNLTAFSRSPARYAPPKPIAFSSQEEIDTYNKQVFEHTTYTLDASEKATTLQKAMKDCKTDLLHALPANTWISVGIAEWIACQTNDWPMDDGDLLHVTDTPKSQLKEIKHRIIN